MIQPRWATPQDNTALIELSRICPMSGSVSLYVDRSPNYFTLASIQGEGAHTCVIDGDDGRPVAVSAAADFPDLFIDGSVRNTMYACDLKIHPKWRGGPMRNMLYKYLNDWAIHDRGCELGFTTVMHDNKAMEKIVQGKAKNVPRYRRIATMRNYTVQYLFRKSPPRGIEVRRATFADVPDMVAFWNRTQCSKNFAPVWTSEGFSRKLKLSLNIDSYFLAFRKDRLVGLLATWDQQKFKNLVVTGYSTKMRRMRQWYNPLSKILGLSRMPHLGQPMPYFYATQLAADTVEDLRALYIAAYNSNRTGRYLFFSTMLDIKDPLNQALDGFLTKYVDIDFCVIELTKNWTENQALTYFDPSLV